MFVAGLGQRHTAGLLVELVVLFDKFRNEDVNRGVEIGTVVERAGNDQRRARLVDQDGVDLVDDGEEVAALHHLGVRVLHVIAQIVESIFVVGTVGDVASVLLFALDVVEVVLDGTDGQPEELVDDTHPSGVAAGEVVVHGDDVHAAPGQCVKIDGKRGDERLAFAGLHLGDAAFVQHHAADKLHVEMTLTQRTLSGLADGGERLGQQVVEGLAVGQALAELIGTRAQLFVGQRGGLGLQCVDGLDRARIFLELALVGGAEDFGGESAEGKHRDL